MSALQRSVLLLEMSTLQGPELHLDVSALQGSVLLPEVSATGGVGRGGGRAASGRVCTTEACAAP